MLRIIGGQYKRKALATPPHADSVRPLPDRVRESTFSMLRGHLEGEAVLDVFAGSGSFGLEALSRGAGLCVMIEKDHEAAGLLDQNITELGIEPERVVVARVDALGPAAEAVAPASVHVVFFDPPYALLGAEATRDAVFAQFVGLAGRLDDTGYALIRTPWPYVDRASASTLSLELPGLVGPETHVYGTTAVHWYMHSGGEDAAGA